MLMYWKNRASMSFWKEENEIMTKRKEIMKYNGKNGQLNLKKEKSNVEISLREKCFIHNQRNIF